MIKARGVAIIPDGIKFSEEQNKLWDEWYNEYLKYLDEKCPTKLSDSEVKKFLRACGIRVDIEYNPIKRIRNKNGDKKIVKYRRKHRKTR